MCVFLLVAAVTGKCSGNTDTNEDHVCGSNGSLIADAATTDKGSDAEANCCEGVTHHSQHHAVCALAAGRSTQGSLAAAA